MRYWFLLSLLLSGAIVPASVQESPLAPTYFQAELIPAGSGYYRYRGIIKIYDARLFLPAGLAPGSALLDVPKRLEITYARSFTAEQIREAGDGVLRKLHAAEKLQGLRPRIDAINALYGAVKIGDRYELEYRPGIGTELRYNGNAMGIIPGADFAEAYFSIWLGRHRLQGGLWEKLEKSWSQGSP